MRKLVLAFVLASAFVPELAAQNAAVSTMTRDGVPVTRMTKSGDGTDSFS